MALRNVTRQNSHDEECTCDGGPFLHGPKGRDQILAKLKRKPKDPKK